MLNKDNFIMTAMRTYDNPSCKTLIEFEEDLAKFSHLVRLCSRDMGNIETHLLLNYVQTLLNIFNTTDCIKIMFFRIKPADWPKLKTILIFLERMPENIPDVGIKNSDIELCQNMIEILRNI